VIAALSTGRRHRQRSRGHHAYRSDTPLLARHLKLTDLLIFPAMVLAVVLGLPVQWGGETSYVLVRGDSMLPVYQSGDLVIVRESNTYEVGAIVAYRVPASNIGAGTLILHRVIGQHDGRFILRGDNNPEDDSWQPRNGSIVGEAVFSIPRIGSFLATVRSPVLLGSLGFGIAFTIVALGPGPQKGSHRNKRGAPLPLPRGIRSQGEA